VEIVEAERFRDGGIKNAKIVFIARDIPAWERQYTGSCVDNSIPA